MRSRADAEKVQAESTIAELKTRLTQQAKATADPTTTTASVTTAAATAVEAKAEVEATTTEPTAESDGAAAAAVDENGGVKPTVARVTGEDVVGNADSKRLTPNIEGAKVSDSAKSSAKESADASDGDGDAITTTSHSTTFAKLVDESRESGVHVFLPTREQRWKPLRTYSHSPGAINHTDIKRYLVPVRDWGEPGEGDTLEAALKGLDRDTTPLVVTFANKAGRGGERRHVYKR